MLICDICGGNKNVIPTQLSFSVKPVKVNECSTSYGRDVCSGCYEKICSMINLNSMMTLENVLCVGLNCRPELTRESCRGD